ncbi:Histidine kinase-, DNA gyrase B-, and HSP90-like ATPase [Mucilaginibacter gossypiicola]|uniref:histidine kinase n=1 Tax=Mucilaginibacter gossypiicola TaxID=551995 RepID=A0A1H8LD35_9SPHI|nr:HAMP domain-containing sensor histidine kinase [Mucilaginibacter gossypiicola]SEO02983.1 Histidine kinase-, DNA gyrase B-, and HSP90-like ATPase [Mucilaginibacter gossypiicola]
MRTKEAELKDNFNQTMIAILAHDLRQPFATLVMTADMIKHTNKALSEGEIHLLFEDLRNTASKSMDLLNGLLYWAKSASKDFVIKTEPLLLHDLIHEANALYLYDQLNKHIILYNIVPESQVICAHKEMIQFINRNILSNATKYSPEGGIIGVTCSEDENWITVAFTDQGNGMSASQIQELFHLNNSDPATSGLLKGAGMAMSICHDMITQMNGRIWAESTIGEGTTFYYALPKTPGTATTIPVS